jgi:hypothetical protein
MALDVKSSRPGGVYIRGECDRLCVINEALWLCGDTISHSRFEHEYEARQRVSGENRNKKKRIKRRFAIEY